MESFKVTQVILVTTKTGHHQGVVEAAAKASLLRLASADLGASEWQEWLSGSFAKVTKQCSRTKIETALREVPGARSYSEGDVLTAAFPPSDLEHRHLILHKAQLQGLNRSVLADQPRPAISSMTGPVVLVNNDLGMSTGKASAQAAHALCALALATCPTVESMERLATHVRVVFASTDDLKSAARRVDVSVIHDAGHTEIPAGSLTAVGIPGLVL